MLNRRGPHKGRDSTFGQEKKKISWSTKPENTKISVQQALEIPDIAGHIIRIHEFRRTWPDGGAPTVEGQKVVEEISRAFADIIAGNRSEERRVGKECR